MNAIAVKAIGIREIQTFPSIDQTVGTVLGDMRLWRIS